MSLEKENFLNGFQWIEFFVFLDELIILVLL